MSANGNAYFVLSEEEKRPDFITARVNDWEKPKEITIPPYPNWVTLYFGGGKKDKINKIDLVGLLCQKGKLKKEEIGLISVLDYTSYVAIKRSKSKNVLHKIRDERVKKKKVKVDFSK